MSFRDNLRHLRAEHNMTQEQLAMLLGVSRQSVTKWEAERSYPEMDKLIKMCEIFDCSLDDLVQGDLTKEHAAADVPEAKTVPDGPAQDICGYDEHQRMRAWKIPTGIACIIAGVALAFFFEGAFSSPSGEPGGVFVLPILAGVLAGLALLIPAGMAHSAFVKAHPFVEDFYTEAERAHARTVFTRGLIGGIAAIFVGVALNLLLAGTAGNLAQSLFLAFVALGVWSIVRYSMLLKRTDVEGYNRNISDSMELEEIMSAQIGDDVRDSLVRRRKHEKKLGSVCGTIMIAATIVGLALLFIPVLASTDISGFTPEGTSAMWFWVAWPVGGMICGIVAIIWDAFGQRDD